MFLPDDILHLICEQSWLQRDFDTLYNCAQAGKQLAAPALALLYRQVLCGSNVVKPTSIC